jgi:hypothetical protein
MPSATNFNTFEQGANPPADTDAVFVAKFDSEGDTLWFREFIPIAARNNGPQQAHEVPAMFELEDGDLLLVLTLGWTVSGNWDFFRFDSETGELVE